MNAKHLSTRLRRAALVLALAGVAAVPVVEQYRAGAQSSGGPQDPVPVVEPASAHKTAYVNLTLTDQDVVTVNPGGIAFSRPPVRIGNPPLIEVILKDKAGNIVERYNAWHPLITFREEGPNGEEGVEFLVSGPGTFPYSFRPAIRVMDIRDIPKNKLLASVDVVAAAIRPFCQANPNDTDCRTDVGVAKTDAPDPVAAGTVLTYTLAVTNHGSNPAYSARVVDTLPVGVTLQNPPAGCTEAPVRTVTCDLGVIEPGESRQVTLTALVDADLVHKAGAPVSISNTAAASNPAGADGNAGNNNASAATRVVAVADLAVDSFNVVAVPPQIVLGQPATVTLRTVVSNGGPSSPMDATLTRTAGTSTGASVSSPVSPVQVKALAKGTPQTLEETYTLGCTRPGYHEFQFATALRPARPDDSDPSLSNNNREVKVTIDCVVPVALNIKPGSNPNSIQLRNNTTIPAAVLTTKEGEYGLPLPFDATRIQPLTVRFGPAGAIAAGTGGASEIHNQGHLEDSIELGAIEIQQDGDTDMVFHFAAGASGLTATDQEGCVKGEFIDSDGKRYRFYGCDAVRFTP